MKTLNKPFKAFGKCFSRKEAERLVFLDKQAEIIFASIPEALEDIILYGWKGVEEWTDQELQNAIQEFVESNVREHEPQNSRAAILGDVM